MRQQKHNDLTNTLQMSHLEQNLSSHPVGLDPGFVNKQLICKPRSLILEHLVTLNYIYLVCMFHNNQEELRMFFINMTKGM